MKRAKEANDTHLSHVSDDSALEPVGSDIMARPM